MSNRLRILFCSPNEVTATLGAPKVLIELAEEMGELDWEVHWLSPRDLGLTTTWIADRAAYCQRLAERLRTIAGEYDAIDYDHETLPTPRGDFAGNTLMVARSVLLQHQMQANPWPGTSPLREVLGHVLYRRRRRKHADRLFATANQTLRQCDLINVSNDDDRTLLVSQGFANEKIAVLPYGISVKRRPLFDAVSDAVPPEPAKIAFVGTFDYRKGAREFPRLVRRIRQQVPDATFKLLGVKGTFTSHEEIRRLFNQGDRGSLDIRLTFKPEELPSLLSDCSVGVFPSHVEGFGFGVLEMLAAAVPVIAYDSPGPPMMLPAKWLVPRGDERAMADKVVQLLRDVPELPSARKQAKEFSRRFNWPAIARDTDAAYRTALKRLRGEA